MQTISITQPTQAHLQGQADEIVLIAPGEYKAAIFIHRNLERETVKLMISDGRLCELERESLLIRRALDPESGEMYESSAPATVADFLEQARMYFGDSRFEGLQFMSRIS